VSHHVRATAQAKALRQVLRGFPYFRVLHEEHGITDVADRDGVVWNYHDLVLLRHRLGEMVSPRQHQAIELGVVEDLSEDDLADLMGLKVDSSAFMYVTAGLNKVAEQWAA
jgi:DNA-directed RNA polymerase specialized sigma24 family protein